MPTSRPPKQGSARERFSEGAYGGGQALAVAPDQRSIPQRYGLHETRRRSHFFLHPYRR
jgi:hypothetical protein